MNQKSNTVTGNQSIIGEGVTEGAIEGVLEDLSVQNAEVIKGGPKVGALGTGVGFDIVDEAR